MTTPILPDPLVTLGDDGTPRSGVSGDIYFSTAGGVDETHHVFLGGIGAPEVWQARKNFRIAELGFGTGLNFLVTWQAWKRTAPNGAHLDYVSVEGYPIDAGTLASILASVPELAAEAAALLAAYPARVGGVHRLLLDGGRVRLTLLYGEVETMLDALTGSVDAWFLDGFAPSKNQAMWTDMVLSAVARLSAPGARLATFSAAGAVRRGLAGVGFKVTKRKGFGYKWACVSAVYEKELPATARPSVARVAVIGAGIAGGCLARSLSARGFEVTLIDRAAEPGAGASGNPVALLAPRLPRERTPMGRLMAAAYLHAVRFYDGLAAEGASVWLGPRGGFTMARNADEDERQERAVQAFGWPDDIMRRVSAGEASRLCGTQVPTGGLWFAAAGALSPPALTRYLARHPARHPDSAATHLQAEVGAIKKSGQTWQLMDKAGCEISEFDAVVMAAGIGLLDMKAEYRWPLRANRGQLAYLPEIRGAPVVPVTYGGYLSPPVPLGNGDRGHVLGATYGGRDDVPEEGWQELSDKDSQQMLVMLEQNLPSITAAPPIGGRVSLRATIRDYMPLAGRVEDGLYVLGGLGSRGFLTAPLLAELVADQISGAPTLLEVDLVSALDPNRFV